MSRQFHCCCNSLSIIELNKTTLQYTQHEADINFPLFQTILFLSDKNLFAIIFYIVFFPIGRSFQWKQIGMSFANKW